MFSNSDQFAIRARSLSKCYQIYDRPYDRLKQSIYPRLQRLTRMEERRYYSEFWALRDISFDILKGETVGIIGRNGSGKSTLLQVICGTLAATGGTVETNGRIAALLELGSGFNPEFTGRENIYMNGAVLGLSQEEIDERFDAIVSFADIGAFIDQPVKTYSSGMGVRLAFAVQAQIEPDILIVDEALSVGDARFQAKCFERLRQLKENGTSILLVTHSSEQIVTHCSRAMLIDQGRFQEIGEPRRVVNRYMDMLFGKERVHQAGSESPLRETVPLEEKHSAPLPLALNLQEDVFSTRPGYNQHEYRWGDGAAAIVDFQVSANGDIYPGLIKSGSTLRLDVAIRFHASIFAPILGVTLKTKEGVTLFSTNTFELGTENFRAQGEAGTSCIATIHLPCPLAHGDYFISLGIASRGSADVIPHDRRYDSIHFAIGPTPHVFGLLNLEAQIEVESVIT